MPAAARAEKCARCGVRRKHGRDHEGHTIKSWLNLSRTELDEIFSAATAGAVPRGEFEGVLIVWVPVLSWIIAAAIRALVWRGKVFDRDTVVNLVTPFQLATVRGQVYVCESWLDAKPSIVIDYSKTSVIAKHVRDEIREVRPGVFLGKVWLGRLRVCDFALTPRGGGSAIGSVS
jgi:hypothetical protein